MKNLIISLVLGSMMVGPAPVLAQTYYSGSGQGTAGVAGSVSFDNDMIDDDIVQLNNLTITNVQYGYAGSLALVTAMSPGIACLKYFDYRAAQGFAYPCPPQLQYQIRVQSNAVLLFANRTRASIGDFTPGDRVNVYGFLDRDGVTMDALIMRDLGAQSSVRRFIQVNNATVQTDPGNGIPTSFLITQDNVNPCLDFSSGRSVTIPCPMGREGMQANDPAALYYPRPRQYQINVNANTVLQYRDRRAMSISEIAVGDTINVYGSFDGFGNIDGLIVRDLSRPGAVVPPPQGDLSFTVTTDKTIYTPGENIFITMRAYNNSSFARTLNFNSGCQVSYAIEGYYDQSQNRACTLALTSVTIPAFGTHTWSITHTPSAYYLQPGTYTLRDTVLGYGSATTNFSVSGSTTGGNRAPVITSVSGPSSLQNMQTGTWVIQAYDPDGTQLSYNVTWGDEGQFAYGATQSQNYMQTGTFTHSYTYTGTYTVTFTVRDASGQTAVSTLTVNVGQSGTSGAPYLNFLSPSNGRVGSSVTIYGTGFTNSNNIYFGGYATYFNVYSADGRTLTFTVPSTIGPCGNNTNCFEGSVTVFPGNHNVYVTNVFGTSNQLGFNVQ